MKPALAILAHESAQATVNDFLPKWKSLGVDLYCSIPQGHAVAGFENYLHLGQSAYSGFYVFDRFMQTLLAMLETKADKIIIAEYDTVNLRPEIPFIRPGHVSSFFVVAEGLAEGAGNQLCALSPWCFDQESGWAFYNAAKESLETDKEYEAGKGLLDRWIGKVVNDYKIPHIIGMEMLGYPWHVGVHQRITQLNLNWIHGWKNKEEFGFLWT